MDDFWFLPITHGILRETSFKYVLFWSLKAAFGQILIKIVGTNFAKIVIFFLNHNFVFVRNRFLCVFVLENTYFVFLESRVFVFFIKQYFFGF